MVKIEEVTDADRERPNSPYSSSSRNSSSTSLSSVASSEVDDVQSESLIDRISALVDIIPPTTRHSISESLSQTTRLLKRGTKFAGNVVWIVTTSALLVGLPLALVLEDEAKIVQQEKEFLAQQQGQQMLAGSPFAPPSPPQGIVPPGF
ncbi:mitochondrial outer membrane translocase complex, subunit Tom22 [Cantharellus anzutake]|uniref:mitochondrial outer membrane translocase complex, subunit Tom22 n=1 Tax=Cantharellus anzutake TaxID=1750568 RepID=UPI001904E079|nr:mitochondrial outer membrane translocase complex, subunit Tom22 [Cantharellus anzutake]KAF8339598.1 mitochondrial outer membrane translocase complex, subunit Tom22 [Cantharellus anzutake]